MATTPHQFGYAQFAGLRTHFQAANRDGIGHQAPDMRVSLAFPADLADFEAAAWVLLGDGTLPDREWADCGLSWLLSILLDEGMGRITQIRRSLAEPAPTRAEEQHRARVRAHVAGLFDRPRHGASRATEHAVRAAITRAAPPADVRVDLDTLAVAG